jgi:hypothetical protein
MANNPRIFGLGTSFDISAATRFRGDSTQLVLQPNSHEEPDQFGVNVLTRKWWCRRDLVESFLPRDGDVDFLHRDLKYWKHAIDYDGSGAMMTTWFNGFIGRPVRVYKSEEDVQLQEVTVTGVPVPVSGQIPESGNANVSVSIVYLSPTITTTYASLSKLKQSEPIAVEPEGKCETIEIRGPNGVVITNTDRITENLADFGIVPRIQRMGFQRRQEGSIWKVTETVQRLLVQQQAFISI